MNADVASLHPKNEATTGKTSAFTSYWGLKGYKLFSHRNTLTEGNKSFILLTICPRMPAPENFQKSISFFKLEVENDFSKLVLAYSNQQ